MIIMTYSPVIVVLFIQNMHEFERIRAIWEKLSESSKIIFQIS